MAEIKLNSGPGSIFETEGKGPWQVTIINQSNHNCPGGTIALRVNGPSGPFQQLAVGPIPIGQQQVLAFTIDGAPYLLGWDLYSDVGTHWGPGGAYVSASSFP